MSYLLFVIFDTIFLLWNSFKKTINSFLEKDA